MVEAIVPRDRNGLLIRALFLLALLGVGSGVLFKATRSDAATTDMTIALASSTGPQADAGEVYNFTVDVSNTDHAPDAASGVVVLQLRFDQGTAVIGADFTVGTATGTNWSCSPLVGVLISCTNFTGIADATAGPTITIPITVQQTATVGRVIRIDTGLDAQTWPEPKDAVDQNLGVTITRTADLQIVKDDVAGTFIAGELVNFPIHVTNLGPSLATPNIVVRDTVPPGLVLDSVPQPFNAGGGFNCVTPAAVTVTGTVITCTRTTAMGVNEVANLTIPFRVAPSQGAGLALPNTATVCTPASACFGGPDIDPNTGNDSDSGTFNTGASFNLGVTKTASVPQVSAGGSFTYQVNYTASGATPGVGATVTDALTGPAGGTYTVSPGAGWACPPLGPNPITGNDVITCTNGSVAVGGGPVATITVNVPANSPGGTFSNSVNITGDNPDPDNSNNNAGPVNVLVTVNADIQIQKCAVALTDTSGGCGTPLTTVATGDDFFYRIIVTNAGPSAAPANTVSVGDSLPSQIAFRGNPTFGILPGTTPAVAGWLCQPAPVVQNLGGQSVTCTNQTDVIDAASSVVINLPVEATAQAPAGQQQCNFASATVTSPLQDPDPSNNTNPAPGACVLVTTISDLGVTKVATPDEVVPGGSITYSIVVSNGGPSPALNPIMTDQVPVGTILQTLTAPAGWTCRKGSAVATIITPANAAGYTGLIYCAGPASMAVGASANFLIKVQTSILLVDGNDTITNTATVSLPPAQTINVEAVCTNPVGPDEGCGLLPDSATATTEVTAYDIFLQKEATVINDPQGFDPTYVPGSVFAGENIEYDITVSNLGEDDAPANVISLGDGRDNELDLLGTVDLSLASQFTCNVGPDIPPQFNKSLTCVNTNGGLPANDPNPPVLQYTAKVDPTTPAGTLVCNSATVHVTPNGVDTNLVNNEAEVCNTVVTSSDLSVQKLGPSEITPGTILTYSIVVQNAGPGIALNPAIYDTIPAGTKFQAVSAPFGWTCVNNVTNAPLVIGLPAGTVIRCQAPSLAVGGALFTLSVLVDATTNLTSIENDGDINFNQVLFGNGACVVAGPDNFVDVNGNAGEINIDLNIANNCDQESTPVVSLAHLNVLKTALNPLYAGQGQSGNIPPYDAPALYRIEVTNTGPNSAASVVFTDRLPGGVTAYGVAPVLEYISGTTSTVTDQASLSLACATYTGQAGFDTCALGDIAAGQTLKFNIRVQLAQTLASFPDTNCDGSAANEAGQQVCNRARFTSTSLEASLNVIPRPTIDTFDDDKQTVSTKSDLAITKAAEDLAGNPLSDSCSGVGCTFNYSITVDNLGPSDTPAQVQFTDIFPAVPAGALKITAVTLPVGWTCDTFPAAGVINVVDLGTTTPAIVVCTSNAPIPAAGAAAEFLFTVEVQLPAVTGTALVNNVCFWQNGTPLAPIDDPVLANNCATNTVAVNNGNTITGFKYLDVDGDGNPADATDNTPIAGFEIFVDDGRGGGTAGDGIKNGGELASVTNALGAYTISGLIGGGPWRVCESPKAGYTHTGLIGTPVFSPQIPVPSVAGIATMDAPGLNSCWTITFQVSSATSKTVSDVNFLNFQNFSISGFKFEDVDGDGSGAMEANESGVDTPAFTLYVDYNDNGIMDPGEPSSTQLPGFPIGDYRISNVGPCQQTGNICQVREVRTAGWVQTYPHSIVANPPYTDATGVPLYPYDPDINNPLNPNKSAANSVPVPVVAGADVPSIQFSNFKLVSISGLKFNDLDADGVAREAGEPTLAGFHICWDFDTSGSCNAGQPEVVTAADGTYSILVGPGTSFIICEDLLTSPSGWSATYPTETSAGNCHAPILADSGDVITNVQFGNFQNILRGFKWNDVALTPVLPDGDFDPDGVDNIYGTSDDEVGLGGWLICAIPVSDPGQTPDCNPSRTYKATTDAQGNYEIRDLPGGTTYRICEEPKAGWNQVYPANACHNLTIPSTSGPAIANHIFGAYYPNPLPVSPVLPIDFDAVLLVDFNFGNNSPLPPVDMSITKTAPSSVVVGASLDFTFQVKNNSAAPATNVKFTDTVNASLTTTLVGTVSPTPGAWSCTFVAQLLTCSRTGQQPANSTETVKVRFTAVNTPGGPFTNTACVTADNPDPNSGNNCSTTNPGTVISNTPAPAQGADLKIEKAASPITAPQQLGPNKVITYKIRVRNLGPAAASNVLITDVLKSGLKFTSWTNKATYTCSDPGTGNTGTIRCGKTNLSANAVNTIEFKVTTPNPVPQDGAGPNDATVEQCTTLVLAGNQVSSFTGCSTSLNDPNPGNNTAVAAATLP